MSRNQFAAGKGTLRNASRWTVVPGIALAVAATSLLSAPAGAAEGPSSAVHISVLNTQRQHSAAVTMTLSGSALKGVTATGTGFTDFATGAMEVHVTYGGSKKASELTLSELVVGGHFYMALSLQLNPW
ncbi:MAG TPA: hypothetical protein VHV57_03230 [Acidimicrobiales bacterium]|jgi:hypothetical protein|nr:hypothetical protein [Acidimicrobiales bacterium]